MANILGSYCHSDPFGFGLTIYHPCSRPINTEVLIISLENDIMERMFVYRILQAFLKNYIEKKENSSTQERGANILFFRSTEDTDNYTP